MSVASSKSQKSQPDSESDIHIKAIYFLNIIMYFLEFYIKSEIDRKHIRIVNTQILTIRVLHMIQ